MKLSIHRIAIEAIGMWSCFFIAWQLWQKPFLEPNMTIKIIETIILLYCWLFFMIYIVKDVKEIVK
jgi:hypothetical protein